MPAPAEAGRVPGPPDGGWGWVVVFGAFVSIGFAYAFPKGLAIFFKEIQDFFGTSYSEIAWVSSIMLATTYGAGEWSCRAPGHRAVRAARNLHSGPEQSNQVSICMATIRRFTF